MKLNTLLLSDLIITFTFQIKQAIKYERIETLLYLNNKVINVLEALFNNIITFEGNQ